MDWFGWENRSETMGFPMKYARSSHQPFIFNTPIAWYSVEIIQQMWNFPASTMVLFRATRFEAAPATSKRADAWLG